LATPSSTSRLVHLPFDVHLQQSTGGIEEAGNRAEVVMDERGAARRPCRPRDARESSRSQGAIAFDWVKLTFAYSTDNA